MSFLLNTPTPSFPSPASVALNRELGVPRAQHDPAPPAGRRAVLAQAAAAELAAHEGGAPAAHNLGAVLALVHLVAGAAVEGVAAVADADGVVSLVFMAPVTGLTKGG